MYVMRSDIEGISHYVILQLQRRNVDLAESARKVLISKAIGAWHEFGLRQMREIIEWEISLLPAIKRANDRYIEICDYQEMRHRTEIETYLKTIGVSLRLYQDDEGFYTRIPKSYDVPSVKAKIRKLLKEGKL